MKIHTPNSSTLLSIIFLIAFSFIQGKDYDISGKVVDSNGEKVGKRYMDGPGVMKYFIAKEFHLTL